MKFKLFSLIVLCSCTAAPLPPLPNPKEEAAAVEAVDGLIHLHQPEAVNPLLTTAEKSSGRALSLEVGDVHANIPSRYREMKMLGEGAFGKAYLVRDTLVRNTLDDDALLVLKSFDASSTSAETLKNEFDIINHPAVSLGRGPIFTENGFSFLPMKYVKGELYSTYLSDLILTKEGRKTIKDIQIKIIDEMTRMHQAGIVHLDLAPRNIIIDTETHLPTFIDYGKAKFSRKIKDQEKDFEILQKELAASKARARVR